MTDKLIEVDFKEFTGDVQIAELPINASHLWLDREAGTIRIQVYDLKRNRGKGASKEKEAPAPRKKVRKVIRSNSKGQSK